MHWAAEVKRCIGSMWRLVGGHVDYLTDTKT